MEKKEIIKEMKTLDKHSLHHPHHDTDQPTLTGEMQVAVHTIIGVME